MKIYCNCNYCKRKIYLASSAYTRQELANSWGADFSINCTACQSTNQFHANSVIAETSQNKIPYATTTGGGLVGFVAGPLGVLIGLAVGGVVGGVVLLREKEVVNRFNNNYL